jgi:hypothetical protein
MLQSSDFCYVSLVFYDLLLVLFAEICHLIVEDIDILLKILGLVHLPHLFNNSDF